jgi:catechol-2,3-dioxygenase
MAIDIVKLRALQPPESLGFKIRRLGHVVLQVTDLERSLLFYTQVLGFKVTEIYPAMSGLQANGGGSGRWKPPSPTQW